MVEYESGGGMDVVDSVADEAGIRLHFSGYRHPQTQGKVERFHGALAAAAQRRGYPRRECRQAWLDEFRYEYNHVRPHEALQMRTPASVWSESTRRYRPNPPVWEYEAGAEVRRLTAQGRLRCAGRNWEISRALAGEWVQLIRVEERILVYYCRSLVRELDPHRKCSTAVDHWSLPRESVKDVLITRCKGCPGTLHTPACALLPSLALNMWQIPASLPVNVLIANLELEFHLTHRKLSPLKIPNRKFSRVLRAPRRIASFSARLHSLARKGRRANPHAEVTPMTAILIHGTAIKSQRNPSTNSNLRISNRR